MRLLVVFFLFLSFIGGRLFALPPVKPKMFARATGFPSLPSDVLERIKTRAFLKGTSKATPARVDSLLSEDWALSSIGFFEVFTPLVQPMQRVVSPCSSDIVVAVVDTGIDYTHPELKNSLWINQGETGPWTPPPGLITACKDKSCNGIDDDGNGFIDDITGWDFVTNTPLPYDTHGHGTHIAGIISAAAANGLGTTGICPGVSIMPLKYYDASGIGYNNLQNTVKALQYAIQKGAHIINYSGGGADPALAERLVIEEAEKKGILVVAAAGNDGHNNDFQPYYPASYPLENIISVASMNRQNMLLPSSNFGRTVHVAAPGLGILSTLPGARFGTMSGTSQATAFVTGVAALMAGQMKHHGQPFDFKKIKKWIASGAKPLKGNEQKTLVSSGILNVTGTLRSELEDYAVETAPALAVVPTSTKKIK